MGPDTVLRDAITTDTLNADRRYYVRGLDVPATNFTSDIEPGAYELNVAPIAIRATVGKINRSDREKAPRWRNLDREESGSLD